MQPLSGRASLTELSTGWQSSEQAGDNNRERERERTMNIDFHYGIVYIAARLGGLPAEQAQTVAHACQYVDDATTTGVLHFEGGETFERFATAHKMFDYENGNDGQNRLVWVPFHFLPAGVG